MFRREARRLREPDFMQHLHKREHLNEGDIVVGCSHQRNIWLMTDPEYSTYSSGRRLRVIGGDYRSLSNSNLCSIVRLLERFA